MRDEITHCVVCGRELPVKPIGNIPKYCENCRVDIARQRSTEHRAQRRAQLATRKSTVEHPLTLDERVRAAKEEGLTYGKYMMKYHPPENMARLPLSHYTGCKPSKKEQ